MSFKSFIDGLLEMRGPWSDSLIRAATNERVCQITFVISENGIANRHTSLKHPITSGNLVRILPQFIKAWRKEF